MNIYKEIFSAIFEIIISVIVIFFAISIWQDTTKNEASIAKMYDNNNEVELLVNNNFDDNIVKLSDETNIDSASIYLHNISGNNNKIALLLKVTKNISNCKDYLILKIGEDYYNLNDLIYNEDEDFYYIKIDKSTFKSYETKDYQIKILANNEYNNCNNITFSYEFYTEI